MQGRKVLLAFLGKLISASLLLAAVFMVGLGIGLCINVFLVRGVPVIRAGGEFLLLFMVPSSFYIGYRFGGNRHNGGMSDIDDADEASETGGPDETDEVNDPSETTETSTTKINQFSGGNDND